MKFCYECKKPLRIKLKQYHPACLRIVMKRQRLAMRETYRMKTIFGRKKVKKRLSFKWVEPVREGVVEKSLDDEFPLEQTA